MGRYIERAEHFARYSKEIYFSSLDAPIMKTYDRKFVLESMLYMTGIFDMDVQNEKEVLFKIGFCVIPWCYYLCHLRIVRQHASFRLMTS